MITEGEVCCGVIKWLIDKQVEYNEAKKGIDIGFWVDRQTFEEACHFMDVEYKEARLKDRFEEDFGIREGYLDKHWLGIENFPIPLDEQSLTPDIITHIYNISNASSETWAIECKGESVDSIKRGFFQVMGHGKAVSKSFIALPKDLRSLVIELKNSGYGVLLYEPKDRKINFEDSIQTRADAELLGYFTRYFRDLHLKERALPYLYGKPFLQRRIALETNLSLGLHVFYNQEKYRTKGFKEAKSFSKILKVGKQLKGIRHPQQHIDDLVNMELIDENYELSDRSKSFFYLLDRELTGINDIKKINDFRKRFPSIQSNRILYKQSDFAFFVANLLKIFLSSNRSIQELIGWISQASREAGVNKPVFAHVITIALKQNPLLLSEMLFFKKTDRAPQFQLNISRAKPNVCASCDRKDKVEFCFCGGDEKKMFKKRYTSYKQRKTFQDRYEEFLEVWKKHLPIEIFHRKDLRDRYNKIFKYKESGKAVEILAPCFVKCLVDTNINKTTAILKHIGILGEEVRSGLKAELCPRFDPLYLNPKMEIQTKLT